MTTDQHLNHMEHAGLIRLAQISPELEYLFRHGLIQDAAYGLIMKGQRQELHAAVGRALEDLYPDRRDELSPVLAHHFDQAGEHERALHYLTLAGDQAASRYAHTEAVRHYRRAIDIAGQAQAGPEIFRHLYLQQGRTHQLSGNHEDALTTYLGLELVARERGDKHLELDALIAQATLYASMTQLQNTEEAVRLSNQALEIAREVGDEPAQSKILWNLSLSQWNVMKLPEALGYAEQSLSIARRLNLREQMAYNLHDLGRFQYLARRRDESFVTQSEAEALWREQGNLPMLTDSLSLKAMLHYDAGNRADTRAATEEAMQISQSIGNWWGQAMCYQQLNRLSLDSGELGAALKASKDGAFAADQAGFALGSVTHRGRLIGLYTYINQPSLAETAFMEALQFASESRVIQGVIGLMQGLNALRNGDPAPARAVLQASELWPHAGPISQPSLVDLSRAQLAFELGDYERVAAITQQLALTPSLQLGHCDISQLARFKADALRAVGRFDEAREALDIALALVSDDNARFQRWEALATLARLAEASGDALAAESHRAQARAEIDYLAARIGNPEFETSFLARPDVTALLATSDK